MRDINLLEVLETNAVWWLPCLCKAWPLSLCSNASCTWTDPRINIADYQGVFLWYPCNLYLSPTTPHGNGALLSAGAFDPHVSLISLQDCCRRLYSSRRNLVNGFGTIKPSVVRFLPTSCGLGRACNVCPPELVMYKTSSSQNQSAYFGLPWRQVSSEPPRANSWWDSCPWFDS